MLFASLKRRFSPPSSCMNLHLCHISVIVVGISLKVTPAGPKCIRCGPAAVDVVVAVAIVVIFAGSDFLLLLFFFQVRPHSTSLIIIDVRGGCEESERASERGREGEREREGRRRKRKRRRRDEREEWKARLLRTWHPQDECVKVRGFDWVFFCFFFYFLLFRCLYMSD